MTDVDTIRRELAAIEQQLAALPAEDFGRRLDLRERRAELRAEARRAGLAARPTDQLEDDLRTLRERHEQLVARRVSAGQVGGGGGPGGGGFEPTVLVNLNAEIDEASGVHEVEQRIVALERELADRRANA